MLCVVTGLLDDPRKVLEAGEKWYEVALAALESQDRWTHQEHALFWVSALAGWPTAGRPTVEHLSVAAAHLRRHGIADAGEIASALHVAPGTVRAAPANATERARPSFRRGLELLQNEPGAYVRSMSRLNRPHLPPEPDDRLLPRVLIDGAADRLTLGAIEESGWGEDYFNPHIRDLAVQGIYEPSPGGPRYLDLAKRYLEQRWYAGDPRVLEASAEIHAREQAAMSSSVPPIRDRRPEDRKAA